MHAIVKIANAFLQCHCLLQVGAISHDDAIDIYKPNIHCLIGTQAVSTDA